jgi:hypothetical protein
MSGGVGGDVKGKEKKKCVRLEAMCDDFLYISHIIFGSPRAINDLNILNSSDHFHRIRTGRWPPMRPEKMIWTLPLTRHHYLVDGIYPRWRRFITSITNPCTDKEVAFSRQQEAVRNGVERVFGVLVQQFQILYRPCRLWHMKSMRNVVLTCEIVHNMVVLERKHRYTGTPVAELGGCDLPSHIVRINASSETEAEHVHLWRTVAVPVKSCATISISKTR